MSATATIDDRRLQMVATIDVRDKVISDYVDDLEYV